MKKNIAQQQTDYSFADGLVWLLLEKQKSSGTRLLTDRNRQNEFYRINQSAETKQVEFHRKAESSKYM